MADLASSESVDRRYRYKFFYLDVDPRLTLYVLGSEYQQRTSPGKRSTPQPAVPRVPKKIALQPLMAGASVCPGGVLEDEAELKKMLQIEDAEQLEQADASLSDDDVEGLPIC